MDEQGRVHERIDRALPPVGSPLADLPAPRQFRAAAARAASPAARARLARSSSPRARRAAARTVRGELKKLERGGEITAAQQTEYRAIYDDALRFRSRLTGSRGDALQGVLNNTNFMAGRGDLTASRLPAIFTTLRRNRDWWATGRLLSYGERVEFNDSELVWQYYPGEGIQLQVLGTFGKGNGLWMAKDDRRLANLLDEMTELASTRGGALAWEYYFYFGGGRPPWASAMAQATGVQVFARASQLLKKPAYLKTAEKGIKLFGVDATTGVSTKTSAGRRFLLYSFSPSQQVLNGFVQTLVGLNDYWEISGDARARKLFQAGERQARLDLAATDTGAWSLYQVGGSEADLNYQTLVTDFIHNLCDRAEIAFWCRADARFRGYLKEAPELELLTERVRGGSTSLVRFEVSKMSKVGLTITRSGSTSLSTSVTVSRGPHGYAWKVPNSPGTYQLVLSGTDLAGNVGRTTATITVTGKARV
ncbi:D-glucuronyl C5-epimerase family protein [Conexibacter stalactiti]|uniref:D-glucuronyl C5-epimerase family protein n=1 Tax=Conexibacter stalactiti TaxID=1940611 RepID=A0ABU4HXG8_9ACTN|nr:D-glucuronyl C5-epimerase family protein [Conexibacter stalactiti]MDW5598023.1 D-glucuronyl C5-epimerase family protein [Conexibacter stalactiti]MEC5038665.1 D-glucuronyl C5-epimerase family protein [Conexibacter stalactiti]